MTHREPHYVSGEPIRPGDRVAWSGSPGVVVLVVGSAENPAEWAEMAEWLSEEHGPGFLVDVERADLVFEHDADGHHGFEDVVLLARGP